MQTAYRTVLGHCYQGLAEQVLSDTEFERSGKSVDLIFTSPPFPLNTKKRYGNLQGQEYVVWLSGFADAFNSVLKDTGSLVIEVGNAWERGRPVMSTLALEALLALKKAGPFELCQQFIWHNPARLPTPAQWVNVERIRVKDAFTHIWWMSRTDRPKANNRRVLTPYSSSMKELLTRGKYNSGKRPSEHNIGSKSFLTDNSGAIPSNVITLANTQSAGQYLKYCREQQLPLHPARMPTRLAQFFIELLTEPGDLVLDPFAGSNTTGAAAEATGRRWIAIEPDKRYVQGSLGRFDNSVIVENNMLESVNRMIDEATGA
jgi:DNA modification methylase